MFSADRWLVVVSSLDRLVVVVEKEGRTQRQRNPQRPICTRLSGLSGLHAPTTPKYAQVVARCRPRKLVMLFHRAEADEVLFSTLRASTKFRVGTIAWLECQAVAAVTVVGETKAF